MKTTEPTSENELDVTQAEQSAIHINHVGRVSIEDFYSIRKALRGNELALKYIGRFLDFANSCLKGAEAELVRRTQKPTALDRAFAEVQYGGQTFLFQRG